MGKKRLVKNIKEYKTLPDDINVGEVWYVNFPWDDDYNINDDGNSIVYDDRPALVIGKDEDENNEKRFTVVKFSHNSYDKRYEYAMGRSVVQCNITATLNEKHFRRLFDPNNPTLDKKHYDKIIKLVKKAEEDGNDIKATLENGYLYILYGGETIEMISEEKLSSKERTDFGLPDKKKYPMPDEDHVRAAIRFFNHCDPEDEKELANNIKKYIKKYNMKNVNVGDNNRFKKYYNEDTDIEIDTINERYLNEDDLKYYACVKDYISIYTNKLGKGSNLAEILGDYPIVANMNVFGVRMPEKAINQYVDIFKSTYDVLVSKGYKVVFEKYDKGYRIIYDEIITDDMRNTANDLNKILTESTVSETVSNKQKFYDMETIYNSLNKEEQRFLGNKFIDSPASVFREVAYNMDDQKPLGFVEIYDGNKLGHGNVGIIEAAVIKEARRCGLGKALVNRGIQWFKKSQLSRLIYLCKTKNTASQKLATKMKFNKKKIEGDHIIYEMINPNKQSYGMSEVAEFIEESVKRLQFKERKFTMNEYKSICENMDIPFSEIREPQIKEEVYPYYDRVLKEANRIREEKYDSVNEESQIDESDEIIEEMRRVSKLSQEEQRVWLENMNKKFNGEIKPAEPDPAADIMCRFFEICEELGVEYH